MSLADEIIGWSGDGRSLLIARTQEMPIRVYRFDPSTGRKDVLKEILPADADGIWSPNSVCYDPGWQGICLLVSSFADRGRKHIKLLRGRGSSEFSKVFISFTFALDSF